MNILELLECKISIEYSIWIQSAVSKSRTYSVLRTDSSDCVVSRLHCIQEHTCKKRNYLSTSQKKTRNTKAPFIPFRPLCCNPTIRTMHGHIRVYNAHLYQIQYSVHT